MIYNNALGGSMGAAASSGLGRVAAHVSEAQQRRGQMAAEYPQDIAPPENTVMSNARLIACQTSASIDDACLRLENLRDRLFGPRAEKDPGMPPAPIPTTAVGELSQALEYQQSLAGRLNVVVSDLERVA